MEVTLDDDQQFFRDTTERFLSTECPLETVRALRDTASGFDDSYWRQGAELGWTSLLAPDRAGGASITSSPVVDLSIVADAFGRHVAPGPLLGTNVVASTMRTAGTDAQQDEAAPLVTGERVAAWVGWEHAFGSGDLVATPSVDGGVVLSGTSAPVEAGAQAHVLLVTASGPEGLVQAIVPAGSAGLSVVPLEGLDLVRRHARMSFEAVPVPATNLVGSAGTAAHDVERQLQVALAIQTAEMVGAAQHAFDCTVEWAFDRYSFGRPLASYQELKHRFADMKTWLEASHALASALAHQAGTDNDEAFETASVAKAYIGQYLMELAQDCIQMHGGIGLTSEHDLHLFVRRIAVGRAMFGLPAQHRRRVAERRVRGVMGAAAA